MNASTHHLEFITPLFNKGMDDNRPEIRPPSIRGQLHWWFRALGFPYTDERAIFGGVGKPARASRIVIRISGIEGKTGESPTLPHKPQQPGLRTCYLPGTKCLLHVLPRLGGPSGTLLDQWNATLEAWLLMGSLGLRTTRGAGSFQWKSEEAATLIPPQDFDTYATRCQELLSRAPFRFALLGTEYKSAEAARRDCSDTIGGRDDATSAGSLSRIRNPLGTIQGRKTSPLRFRVVGLNGHFRIAALWDGRHEVTHNSQNDLRQAIHLLVEKDKPIGHQLAKSPLA